MPTFLAVPGVPDPDLAATIVSLSMRILPSPRPVDLHERLAHTRDPWGVVAMEDDVLVGFKLGYSDRPGRFYSWLGGVDPEYRRRGIASELLRRQHERCAEVGYQRVRTHTTNDRKAMLLLNIRSGFDIVGTTTVPGAPMKIVLERQLG